ncbi:MAG: nuclear transport factor 2 family protein [Xanthobacteraceae bacterium]|nr:nuclear transport factor 2 family protein [Xanthobacteraceae bacterium]
MPIPVVETPITGREALGELREPIQALAQFYRAINGRDLTLMEENWESSENVAMDNPLGGIKRGWPEIRSVYERVFRGTGAVQVEFHDYTIHVAGDVFYAVGRERGTYEGNGVRLDLAIRTSRIFRRVEDRWRQVHHHGSIDDPQLLQAYQEAVNGVRRPSERAG